MEKKSLLLIISIFLIVTSAYTMTLPMMQSLRAACTRIMRYNKVSHIVGFLARHKYLAIGTAVGALFAIPKIRCTFMPTRTMRLLIRALHRIRFRIGLYSRDAMHRAIEHNNIEEAGILSTNAEQITTMNEQHNRPLIEAALRGNREIVQILLRAGAPLENVNYRVLTALHAAAINGNRELVRDLLNAVHGQADLLGVQCGYTPLCLAVEHGHAGAVEELIAAGATVNFRSYHTNNTPLHRASFHGYTDVAQVLLNAGAHIDLLAEELEGETPLHLAALNRHYDTVRLLIRYGANINILDGRGRRFDQVTNDPCLQVFRRLTDELITAAQRSDRATIMALIDQGASVVSTNAQGTTAIHSAIGQPNKDNTTVLDEIAKDILRIVGHRAAIARNAAGQTPLHIAVQQGNTRIARLLLQKYGAEVNARDNLGNTALHFLRGSSVMRDLLVYYHADATIRNNACETPISCAVNVWQSGFGISI